MTDSLMNFESSMDLKFRDCTQKVLEWLDFVPYLSQKSYYILISGVKLSGKTTLIHELINATSFNANKDKDEDKDKMKMKNKNNKDLVSFAAQEERDEMNHNLNCNHFYLVEGPEKTRHEFKRISIQPIETSQFNQINHSYSGSSINNKNNKNSTFVFDDIHSFKNLSDVEVLMTQPNSRLIISVQMLKVLPGSLRWKPNFLFLSVNTSSPNDYYNVMFKEYMKFHEFKSIFKYAKGRIKEKEGQICKDQDQDLKCSTGRFLVAHFVSSQEVHFYAYQTMKGVYWSSFSTPTPSKLPGGKW